MNPLPTAIEHDSDALYDYANERCNPPAIPRLRTLDEIAADAVAEARKRDEARRTGRPLGPSIAGFSPALAQLIDGGFLPTGYMLAHGGAGAAKTCAATKIAMTCGVPALIVESELRDVRMLERMTATTTREYLGRFRDGSIDAERIAGLVAKTIVEHPMVAIIDATAEAASLDEIVTAANAWRSRHGSEHVFVAIDSMQSWSAGALADAGDEYARTNAAIQMIRSATSKHAISMLVISERSMANMGDAGAAHGKNSGSTGYQAEITFGFDAGDYDAETGITPINLTIAKNRWGAQHVTVGLWFEGRVQDFTDADQPHRKQRKSNGNGKSGTTALASETTGSHPQPEEQDDADAALLLDEMLDAVAPPPVACQGRDIALDEDHDEDPGF
jgi:hypothetical protein